MASNLQQLYLYDPEKLNFQSRVKSCFPLGGARYGVTLEHSYFYPTGGGQEHDTGWLGEAPVLDVYKADELLVHVVDRPLPTGIVDAKIDPERRIRHRQHHTAQHLLSQSMIELFDLETQSANINGYTPSTLDLPVTQFSVQQLNQAEKLANQLIFEDRAVRAYFVSADALLHIPLRRPPKVDQDIRIVEIDGFDYSACGGTHCTTTGQIGVLKILRTEKQNERTRIHFVAGWQALELFQTSYETVASLAAHLSIGAQELTHTVLRQSETLQRAQQELRTLRMEHLEWEAQRLSAEAETVAGQRIVLAFFEKRAAGELRILAAQIAGQPGLSAVLASQDGGKLSLAVACSDGSELSADQILKDLLVPFNGRGGGDTRLAQGGGRVVKVHQSGEVLRNRLEALLGAE